MGWIDGIWKRGRLSSPSSFVGVCVLLASAGEELRWVFGGWLLTQKSNTVAGGGRGKQPQRLVGAKANI